MSEMLTGPKKIVDGLTEVFRGLTQMCEGMAEQIELLEFTSEDAEDEDKLLPPAKLPAVDTAPSIISIEISGVIMPAPIPFCTIRRVGTLAFAISGLVLIVMIPRTTIVIIRAFTTNPRPILFMESLGLLKAFACWTNTAILASWNVPYKNAE